MRTIALIMLASTLAACALPAGLTITSLAASGISYVATGKGIVDHAISGMVQRDCNTLRAVKGEGICNDLEAIDRHMIAAADAENPSDYLFLAEPWERDAGGVARLPATYVRRPVGDVPRPILIGDGGPERHVVLHRTEVVATLARSTGPVELFALIQDSGALELYLHDPRSAKAELRLVLVVDNYASLGHLFRGVSMDGTLYPVDALAV